MMKGYKGDSWREWKKLKMVRNGKCIKWDKWGEKRGWSW